MININGEIIPQLSDEAFKLISALCDYGKISHPDNEVLLKKCGWGNNIRKLQRAKKELVSKGILSIDDRYKYNESGKRVRASNKYTISSELISKYRGDSELCKYEQFTFEQFRNELVHFELGQKSTDNKVLKLISIETLKELKEYIYSLEKEKKEASLDSNEGEEPKKVAPKKGKRTFPETSASKKYEILDKRPDKNLPFDASSAFQTVKALDFEECRLYALNALGIDIDKEFFQSACESFATEAVSNYNQYRGIMEFRVLKDKFMSWLGSHYKYKKNAKNWKPKVKSSNSGGSNGNEFFCTD